MFDTDKVMHRFDMSEFMEAHSVARLFGSPPGYVGHDEGGQLTEAIKRNPYSIVLFDEIEKAHPRVFDTLLQILDAGRMTDGKGETVDFRNTIVIMTSNIGSHIIQEGLEKGYPFGAIEIAILDEIKNHFRPEFLNRFDAKVVFNSLAPAAVRGISESELKKLRDRLQIENELDLYWHMDLATMITNEAYDINDGARPIKRFINNTIINELTENILSGNIKRGDTIYAVPNEAQTGVTIVSIPREVLSQIQEEEVNYISLKNNLIQDTTVTHKVKEEDIIDADINDIGEGAGKKKKKKKKSKKDIMNMTFDLKTQSGD
jgi:ATP-dependent Clp protease ATP-binding subunit ClpB